MTARQRAEAEQAVPSTIGSVPLFAGLPAQEIERLAATLKVESIGAGAILFSEGERGDRFYVLLDGEIAIVKALGTDDERLVGIRGPGEFVGEMSLLHADGLRTASVLVRSAARALMLTRADFDALLHRHPALAYTMLRVMSERLSDSHTLAIQDLHEKNRRLAEAYAELQAAQPRLIEQEALARELRLAGNIQASMLPQRLPHLPCCDLAAHMTPARVVGGDFFDVIELDDDRLALAVGDVSGKGMPAALVMALAISLLRAEAVRSDSPVETVLALNRHLLNNNVGSMFVTLLYAIYRYSTRELTYARAGHDLPVVLDAHGAPVPIVRGTGQPIGLFDTPLIDGQSLIVPPGGSVLLYSDGVTESTNRDYELFGRERTVATASAYAQASATELCAALLDALAAHHGESPQDDDLTLLVMRLA